MGVPLGILCLSLGTTVVVTFVAWLGTRRERMLASRRSALITHLVAAPVIELAIDPPPPSPIAPVPVRAPNPRPATPHPLGYQLERLIDVYVAQAMQMTGTSRAAERRAARTPGLATQIAKKLSHELVGVDAPPEELAVANQRLDKISDEILLEVSRLLEIDPDDVFEVTSDPVIEPPSLEADESGPLEPPTPPVAPASATQRPPSDAWDEPPSDPTIVDACKVDTEPSALRYLAIPRVFGIEPTPPLPPARAPRGSRTLTPITVVDAIRRDFDDEADTISVGRRGSSRRFATS